MQVLVRAIQYIFVSYLFDFQICDIKIGHTVIDCLYNIENHV